MNSLLPSQKKNILIFDRDSEFVEALSLYFEETHEVYGFPSIYSLHHQKIINPNIILLELLPIMHTCEIQRIIYSMKKLYAHVPIFLISTNKKILQKASCTGIRDFFEKPFDITLLEEKLYSLN